MKTCILFGFIAALAGAFLVLIEFFVGLHSDISRLPVANVVGSFGGLAISITCTVLGVKARRADVPAGEAFGYGRAAWSGIVINAVGSVLSAVFLYAYYAFINPGFADILLQDSSNKLEAKGLSGDRLEKIEAFNRIMFTPGWMAVFAVVLGLVFGVVLALIVAAFLKRPAPAAVPAA